MSRGVTLGTSEGDQERSFYVEACLVRRICVSLWVERVVLWEGQGTGYVYVSGMKERWINTTLAIDQY